MGPAGGRHTNEWKTSVNSEGSGSPRKNLMGEHLPFTKFKILWDMPVYAEGGTHPPDVSDHLWSLQGWERCSFPESTYGSPVLPRGRPNLPQTEPRQKLTGFPPGGCQPRTGPHRDTHKGSVGATADQNEASL